MPLSRCARFVFLLFFAIPGSAQSNAPAPVKDAQALAVVQSAIKALGGAGAIGQAQSWSFQSQVEGSFENGSKSETFAAKAAPVQNPAAGASPPAKLPSWARPHSLFVPALVGSILLRQSEGSDYSMGLQPSPQGLEGVSIVVFSLPSGGAKSVPAQIWHFDKTTGLPKWIWFIAPVSVGSMQSLPDASVLLSDYRAVGGVLYPHLIETILQHTHQRQVITLQSVTPNATAGGVQ